MKASVHCKLSHGSINTWTRTSLHPHQQTLLSGSHQQQPVQPAAASRPSTHGRFRCKRDVIVRVYKSLNDELADRTREVWDDEEDVQAAASRLGYDRDSLPADSGPLLTEMNELYVEQQYPQEGFVGQLELRYMPDKGYGLFATQQLSQGSLVAVCLPLAWVSGPPGQPPPLEALARHLANSHFSARQKRVMASLASLPALDEAHEQAIRAQQQEVQQDVVLRQAQELQVAAAAPGLPAGSLPLSKAAAIKRAQQQLRAKSEYISWEDDGEDEGEEDHENDREDDYEDEDVDWEDGRRYQRQLSSGSSVRRWLGGSNGSSSSSGVGVSARRQGKSYRHERRAPDMLDVLECTKPAPAAAAAAGGGAAATAAVAVRGAPLGFPTDRLTALVCRNALLELSQDLPTASLRGDTPASLTGIWPLLALFNHSCAPNAVAVTIGHQPPQQQQQQQSLLPQQQQQQQLLRGNNGKGVPVNPWASKAKLPGSNGSSSSGSSSSRQLDRGGAGLTYSCAAGVGPFVVVRVVAEVSPGDEVTLDYLSAGIEGSLVHRDRRRAALAQRWGFTCRCERCTSEQQLGPAINRTLQSANTLAARLGPQVSAAVAAAAAARQPGPKVTPPASSPPPAAAAAGTAGPRVSEAAAAAGSGDDGGGGGGAVDVLGAAAGRLLSVIKQLEQQVDRPDIPPRVAAWAHASIYQAHALLAVARCGASPRSPRSLGSIGTASELSGVAAAGSAVHVLSMALLVAAADEAWGGEDVRVDGALEGLLRVLQLRYGPLQAGPTTLLARAAQLWAHRSEAVTLALLSPAAAAAVQARKHLATAAAAKAAAAATAAATTAASAADSEEAEGEGAGEDDGFNAELSAELALEADEVLEVTEEEVEALYNNTDQQQQQEQQDAAGPPAAAAAGPGVGGVMSADGDVLFVRQRSEAEVLAELELYTGYRQALPPEQQQQQYKQQGQDSTPQQQQQQQLQQTPAVAQGITGSQQVSPAAAAAAGREVHGADGGPGDEVPSEDVPLLTSWLQGTPAGLQQGGGAATAATTAGAADNLQQQQQLQVPLLPNEPRALQHRQQQKQKQEQKQGGVGAVSISGGRQQTRPASGSSSSSTGMPRPVRSLFPSAAAQQPPQPGPHRPASTAPGAQGSSSKGSSSSSSSNSTAAAKAAAARGAMPAASSSSGSSTGGIIKEASSNGSSSSTDLDSDAVVSVAEPSAPVASTLAAAVPAAAAAAAPPRRRGRRAAARPSQKGSK